MTSKSLKPVAPASPVVEPPSHLSERSSAFWRSVVADYELEPHHLELLRRVAEAMDVADLAVEVIRRDGVTTTTRLGEVKAHPAVAIERDARLAVARLLRELDLDAAPPPETRPPRRGR